MFVAGTWGPAICIGGGGARAAEILAACPWSKTMLTGRPLRGGE